MNSLELSRAQFGDTAAFHIIWPMLSIGLSFFMLIMEIMWLWTKKDDFYHQLRFWSKVFILTFGIGVASGIPLQFQFGTNWAAFSNATGDFFGNILGFESTVAFALESAFLAIFVFGWKRVGRRMHLFANAMVFVGATLSAFWIMAANSWMQIPRGVTLEGTKLVVTDYWQAIFNPGTLVSFGHMWVACVETTLFFMLGWCALALLSHKQPHRNKVFYLQSFRYTFFTLIIFVPLQILLGHTSGEVVGHYQPQKLAAIELHWDTNKPGTGAGFNLFAIPDGVAENNSFAITIPHALSIVTTGSPTGQVQGLKDFPKNDRPTAGEAAVASYSFRLMMFIGFLFAAVLLWGLWYWYREGFKLEKIVRHRLFLWLWVVCMPLGFVATIAGWMTREIGRQPWVVYNLMRTHQGLSSNLDARAIMITMTLFTILFLFFIFSFLFFTHRIMKKGPDLAKIPPAI